MHIQPDPQRTPRKIAHNQTEASQRSELLRLLAGGVIDQLAIESGLPPYGGADQFGQYKTPSEILSRLDAKVLTKLGAFRSRVPDVATLVLLVSVASRWGFTSEAGVELFEGLSSSTRGTVEMVAQEFRGIRASLAVKDGKTPLSSLELRRSLSAPDDLSFGEALGIEFAIAIGAQALRPTSPQIFNATFSLLLGDESSRNDFGTRLLSGLIASQAFTNGNALPILYPSHRFSPPKTYPDTLMDAGVLARHAHLFDGVGKQPEVGAHEHLSPPRTDQILKIGDWIRVRSAWLRDHATFFNPSHGTQHWLKSFSEMANTSDLSRPPEVVSRIYTALLESRIFSQFGTPPYSFISTLLRLAPDDFVAGDLTPVFDFLKTTDGYSFLNPRSRLEVAAELLWCSRHRLASTAHELTSMITTALYFADSLITTTRRSEVSLNRPLMSLCNPVAMCFLLRPAIRGCADLVDEILRRNVQGGVSTERILALVVAQKACEGLPSRTKPQEVELEVAPPKPELVSQVAEQLASSCSSQELAALAMSQVPPRLLYRRSDLNATDIVNRITALVGYSQGGNERLSFESYLQICGDLLRFSEFMNEACQIMEARHPVDILLEFAKQCPLRPLPYLFVLTTGEFAGWRAGFLKALLEFETTCAAPTNDPEVLELRSFRHLVRIGIPALTPLPEPSTLGEPPSARRLAPPLVRQFISQGVIPVDSNSRTVFIPSSPEPQIRQNDVKDFTNLQRSLRAIPQTRVRQFEFAQGTQLSPFLWEQLVAYFDLVPGRFGYSDPDSTAVVNPLQGPSLLSLTKSFHQAIALGDDVLSKRSWIESVFKATHEYSRAIRVSLTAPKVQNPVVVERLSEALHASDRAALLSNRKAVRVATTELRNCEGLNESQRLLLDEVMKLSADDEEWNRVQSGNGKVDTTIQFPVPLLLKDRVCDTLDAFSEVRIGSDIELRQGLTLLIAGMFPTVLLGMGQPPSSVVRKVLRVAHIRDLALAGLAEDCLERQRKLRALFPGDIDQLEYPSAVADSVTSTIQGVSADRSSVSVIMDLLSARASLCLGNLNDTCLTSLLKRDNATAEDFNCSAYVFSLTASPGELSPSEPQGLGAFALLLGDVEIPFGSRRQTLTAAIFRSFNPRGVLLEEVAPEILLTAVARGLEPFLQHHRCGLLLFPREPFAGLRGSNAPGFGERLARRSKQLMTISNPEKFIFNGRQVPEHHHVIWRADRGVVLHCDATPVSPLSGDAVWEVSTFTPADEARTDQAIADLLRAMPKASPSTPSEQAVMDQLLRRSLGGLASDS